MSIILASGDFETVFVDGIDGEGPLTLTARCNFCGHTESSSWAEGDRDRAFLNDEGRTEGMRTAYAMFDHILEQHPEKLLSARE
jgi:hypothetical protein